jgi:hypothetical protein
MYCGAPVLLNGRNVTVRIRVDGSYAITINKIQLDTQ